MRAFILTICLFIAFGTKGFAETSEPKDTISAQIDAFLADDVETAYSFASPTIQNIFDNPDTFGQMVRDGYPMVWRPADVIFLDTQEINQRLYQRVQIIDEDGQSHSLVYEMILIGNMWKINGVFNVMPAGESV